MEMFEWVPEMGMRGNQKMNYRIWFRSLILLAFLNYLLRFQNLESAAWKWTVREAEMQELTVILQLFYLDGEVREEIVTEHAQLEDLWHKYKDWDLVDFNTHRVVFKKNIDDISPLLKANGYFGLSEDGILSVFDGKPANRNVIHSFFQIDIQKLESRKQEQLAEGIPVRTKEDFQKVLNAYKPFSRTTTQ